MRDISWMKRYYSISYIRKLIIYVGCGWSDEIWCWPYCLYCRPTRCIVILSRPKGWQPVPFDAISYSNCAALPDIVSIHQSDCTVGKMRIPFWVQRCRSVTTVGIHQPQLSTFNGADLSCLRDSAVGVAAVSYTHLDVYKRQPYGSHKAAYSAFS